MGTDPTAIEIDDIDPADIELPEGAELAPEQYPPYAEDRARFRMAYAIAWHIFDGEPANTWQAARSIYKGDIPD
jgi:hypothetical protein